MPRLRPIQDHEATETQRPLIETARIDGAPGRDVELSLLCAEANGVGKFARSLQMRTWDEACGIQPVLRTTAEEVIAK